MPTISTASASTLQQISLIEKRAHPLLICDVDEVLLQFIPHLERFMLTMASPSRKPPTA
ncbi:hypothetical protein [Pseudovibrio denitrificans]|uniref:hypothetical protein n=1 Tax=Pseudovibrio denitrificans TaxID=258256 RepID=UPI000A6B2F09|nr:hypothetical protein [Pseudovibrio denitrificans]